MSYRGKRLLDIAVAVPAFALTLPIQVAAGIAIRVSMGTPVTFRQLRPGRHGVPFEMVKLRTMLPFDAVTGRTDDASRLTPLGRLLRSLSIDELPSLINVIRGDMSMVGPRPLLMEYLYEYTPEQARRHDVRPGLTGLAQVMGRNSTSWERRFALDVDYVDDHNIRRDLNILGLTIVRVLQRRGISAANEATMPRYKAQEDPTSR